MSLPRMLDELEYRLPGRYAIRLRRMSGQIRMATIHLRYWQRGLERYVWWLVALAGVLAYLVLAAWLENQDLKDGARARNLAIAHISQENDGLRAQLAEVTSTRAQKLIYLIEAGSTTEAKDKLARAAMLVAAAHFDLQEATRESK